MKIKKKVVIDMISEKVAAYIGLNNKYYKWELTEIQFEKIIKRLYPTFDWEQNRCELKIYSDWLSLEKDCAESKIDYLFISTIDVFNDISLCIKKLKKLKEMNKPPLVYFVLEDICSFEKDFEDSILLSNRAKELVRFFQARKRMMNRVLTEK